MENFEILNPAQLLNITGGHNELTERDELEDIIV